VGCHDDTVKRKKGNVGGGGGGGGDHRHSTSAASMLSPNGGGGQGYSTLRNSDTGNGGGGVHGQYDANNTGGGKEEDGLMHLVKQLNPEDLVIVDLDLNEVIQPRNPYNPDEPDENAVTFHHLPRNAGMVNCINYIYMFSFHNSLFFFSFLFSNLIL
jgi:hypothetical protein